MGSARRKSENPMRKSIALLALMLLASTAQAKGGILRQLSLRSLLMSQHGSVAAEPIAPAHVPMEERMAPMHHQMQAPSTATTQTTPPAQANGRTKGESPARRLRDTVVPAPIVSGAIE